MSRRVITIVLLVVLGGAACDSRPRPAEFDETTTSAANPAGEQATTTTPTLPAVEERVVGSVTEIVDGDTVKMTIDGTPTTVRLLGINAPEIDECWGPESASVLSGLITGKQLLVVSGDEDLDGFGRSLRFLFEESGDEATFINADLVAAGHAIALQDGNEYSQSFKASEARAFQSGKGMWGTFACGNDEGVRADRPVIRIAELQANPQGPDDDALDQEFVTIVNEGYGRVAISNWVLRDESSIHRLTMPAGTVLAPGDSLTVVTGCSGGPADAIHWCSDIPIWSNGGDTAIVSDSLGNAVVWFSYSATGSET